jgi:pyruvate formate lyase activating enzyme
MDNRKGTILRIERLSNQDGDGLRTVVFFKGCPLRCAWCSTPESHASAPEWSYRAGKCVGCGACVRACPTGALSLQQGRLVQNLDACVQCFACAQTCPTQAIQIYGQEMTVPQIMKEIRKDQVYFFHSGGGVTLSGGDILLQADFARELLMACQDEVINTSAEMDFYGSYQNVQKLLPYLDSIYIDVKMMDPQRHKKWTGVDNQTILDNIARADRECRPGQLRIRVPLIAGINNDRENVLCTAEFCASLSSCGSLEFLPYHRLGTSTYQYLGRPYPLADMEAMSVDTACDTVGFLAQSNWPFVLKVSGHVLNTEQ